MSDDTAQLRADTLSLLSQATRRDEILAGKGAFPSFDELQRGLPFLRGDFLLDVQTFVETELLETDLTPKARKALSLAKSNPTATTLRAAADTMPDTTHVAARRLDLYACWMGDTLGRDRTIRRGFEDLRLHDIAQSTMPLAIAFGLTRYSIRGYRPAAVSTETVDRVFEQGIETMQRMSELSARLMVAMKSVESGDEPASTRLADAMDEIAALAEDRCEIEGEDIDDGIPDDYLGNPPGPPTHRLLPVLDIQKMPSGSRTLGKTWSGIAGEDLPLILRGDVAGRAAALRLRFPYAVSVIDTVLRDLASSEPVRFRPTLFVGAPGSGKTSLARAIAEAFGMPFEVYNLAGQGDSSLMGTSAQWSTARESVPLQMLKRSRTGNGIVVWDEIEKTAESRHNGSAMDALLPLLERSQAKAYRDLALEVDADLSMVSHFGTANTIEGIPAPIRDRMRVIVMPEPEWHHVGDLARQIVADIASERGIDPRWIAPIAPDEFQVIRSAWDGGSLRRLRMALEVLVDGRDAILGRA